MHKLLFYVIKVQQFRQSQFKIKFSSLDMNVKVQKQMREQDQRTDQKISSNANNFLKALLAGQLNINRTTVAFWALGVLNNTPYVIMLAAAKSISEGGTALVFLANIAPGLLLKLSAPYWFDRVGYSTRMAAGSICMAGSFGIVGLFSLMATMNASVDHDDYINQNDNHGDSSSRSSNIGMNLIMQLLGVALGSTQTSLGEASLLALAGRADSLMQNAPDLEEVVNCESESEGHIVDEELTLKYCDGLKSEGRDCNVKHDLNEARETGGQLETAGKGRCITAFSSGTGIAGIFGFTYIVILCNVVGISLMKALVLALALFPYMYWKIYDNYLSDIASAALPTIGIEPSSTISRINVNDYSIINEVSNDDNMNERNGPQLSKPSCSRTDAPANPFKGHDESYSWCDRPSEKNNTNTFPSATNSHKSVHNNTLDQVNARTSLKEGSMQSLAPQQQHLSSPLYISTYSDSRSSSDISEYDKNLPCVPKAVMSGQESEPYLSPPPQPKDVIKALSFYDRFKLTLSLWPYMVPLFVVYFAEYALQSGAWTAIGFPVGDVKARDKFYVSSNWMYQVGVFISRSSGVLFTAPMWLLWLMPILQCINLVFFYNIAVWHFWYNYSLLIPCFYVGLLGGGVYVNGYMRINMDLPLSIREFALSTASVADGFGIMFADISGLFIQSCLYRANGIDGAVVNCPLK